MKSPTHRKKTAITKTCLYNFDPLKPHFYIVKLGYPGVYIIFLYLLKNIDCGYSLEPPRRGGSNEYPQSMFWAEIWKISEFFIWKFSIFFGGKISVYLNRRVFVMNRGTALEQSLENKSRVLNHFNSRGTSPLILMQLQGTIICTVRIGVPYLLCETSQHHENMPI